MNYNLKATYTLTDKDIFALFWTALTSGSIGYGMVSLDTDRKTYDAVKAYLKERSGNDYVVIEDIWVEVFKMGKLTYTEYDDVNDCNEPLTPVTIDDCRERLEEMQQREPWILEQFARYQDDANTHDAFLQYLLLGEIVYG